jgi:hypothetical protein
MTSAGKSREIRISVTYTVYHTSLIGELMPQIQTNKWTNNTRNSPLSLGPNNEKTSKECILFLHFVMIDDETHDILVDLKGMAAWYILPSVLYSFVSILTVKSSGSFLSHALSYV